MQILPTDYPQNNNDLEYLFPDENGDFIYVSNNE